MLSPEVISNYTAILKDELRAAMGCTEPIAIAYAASILTDVLGGPADAIAVGLSGNIIKNVKSVVVPATGGMHGIESAVAAGVIANDYHKKLEVLSVLGESDIEKIVAYKETCKMSLFELNSQCSFDLHLTGNRGDNSAEVRITDHHTNVVKVTLNGISLIDKYGDAPSAKGADEFSKMRREGLLNVRDIVTFAEEVDLEELRPYLEKQIELNMTIAEEAP